MSILIRQLEEKDVETIRAFNKRLSDGGAKESFPEVHIPSWLPKKESSSIFQEYYIALEEDTARGAYILKWQPFYLNGKEEQVCGYQLPIAESIVNPKYNIIPLRLMGDALARNPLMTGLGGGRPEEPSVRLLLAAKWKMVPCPFFFRIIHPKPFLDNIVYLRKDKKYRFLLDFLANTGLGWLGMKSLFLYKDLTKNKYSKVESRVEPSFDGWCDQIWEEAKDKYSLIATRTKDILNTLYPASRPRFIRLRVTTSNDTIGWVVLLNTKMKDHNFFGNMRVGTIVDCLALPGEEGKVIKAGYDYLVSDKADIVISNQLHQSWCEAFKNNGFLRGPSNFFFFTSPELTSQVSENDPDYEKVHMTRGDGDGPINL